MRQRLPLKPRTMAFALTAVLPYAYLTAGQAPPAASKVSFGKDIAPIFKAHCTSCHSGPNPAGKLDLAAREGILKGGASGLLTGFKAESSLLMRRIDGTKGPQMPLGMAPLSAEEQSRVRAWISQGMSFDVTAEKHWAYLAPAPPKIPPVNSRWVQNPIDAFVLQRLKKEGLHPSPPASRESLIRRVTLDLTGLLPTPQEVETFVADKSPGAYEKVVDRLMSSPHYGERQARGWLDLARYADSDGYEKDLTRTAYLYRDWVIDAFNQNIPFDQFTIKQLAGDLLPNATVQDKIATGFQRNSMFNREGGVDQEEAHFLVVLDRAEVTSTVWLGSTLNCARCHDHKYDPFTQKDYYKMVAYYNNTAIYPRGPKDVGEEKWFEAELKNPTRDQAATLAKLKKDVLDRQSALAQSNSDETRSLATWIAAAKVPVRWKPVIPSGVKSHSGAALNVSPDGIVIAAGKVPDTDSYTVDLPAQDEPISGLRLDVLPDSSLPALGPGRADNGNFVLSHFKLMAAGAQVPCSFAKADYTQPQYDPLKSLMGDSHGWAIDGATGKPHSMVVDLDQPIPASTPFNLELSSAAPYVKHIIGKFRISVCNHPDATTFLLPDNLRASLDSPASQDVKSYWAANDRTRAGAKVRLLKAQSELAAAEAIVPTALVMQEKPTSKTLAEWVRHRGEFNSKTELVQAGTPSVLPPPLPGRQDRLALAKWLVSRSNPLTARVQVNRMWEQLFGRGLVETSEDFGTRGSTPTHPELLDWLACKFMNSGWDMKALNRLIVTSSTYRQTSSASPELIARDPQNLLLARGARFRMEAEMIHDVALDAGGILSPKIGGPSVFPYQPDGTWGSPFSGQEWTPSKGEDAYRRGIYTFWKRTSPYPNYVALDATSRESCTVRRIRTNTPLQALALLNDKLMLRASAELGKRMESSAKDVNSQLALGFEICTSRRPKPAELLLLAKLEKDLERRYQSSPKTFAKLAPTPKDAAFTMVGNVLLNLDETITKG